MSEMLDTDIQAIQQAIQGGVEAVQVVAVGIRQNTRLQARYGVQQGDGRYFAT